MRKWKRQQLDRLRSRAFAAPIGLMLTVSGAAGFSVGAVGLPRGAGGWLELDSDTGVYHRIVSAGGTSERISQPTTAGAHQGKAKLAAAHASVFDLISGPQSRETKAFLVSNPQLLPVIREARRRLWEVFGECPLRLDFSADYDGTDYEFAILHVVVDMDPEPALELHEQFASSWWTKEWDRIDGRLSIDLEFA